MTISKELLDELLKGVERPEDLLGEASAIPPPWRWRLTPKSSLIAAWRNRPWEIIRRP